MEFSPFDKRGYATLGVRDGYAEWAGTYERTVTTPQLTMNIYEAHRIVQGDDKAITSAMERMRAEAVGDLSGRGVSEGNIGGAAGSGGRSSGASTVTASAGSPNRSPSVVW